MYTKTVHTWLITPATTNSTSSTLLSTPVNSCQPSVHREANQLQARREGEEAACQVLCAEIRKNACEKNECGLYLQQDG